jgi:cell division protein FtsI (penicillin-binding protein 3)
MSVTTRHAAQRARAVAPRQPSTPPRVAKRPPLVTKRPARATQHPARPSGIRHRARPVIAATPRPQRPAPDRRRPRPRPARTRSSSWVSVTFQRRIRLVRLVLVLAAVAVVARLVDIQVIHAGTYQAAASQESSTTVNVPALRAGIFDRSGEPLALSQPTDDVIADDFQVAHPVQTATALSPLLGVPVAALTALLERHTGYVVLAKQITQSNGRKIANDDIPGITLVGDSKRIVPNGNLASPVIGFTNGSGVGAAGIEYGDNKELAGTSGRETILQSPSGVTLPQTPVTDRVPAKAGTGLELTLDSQLQYETEQALAGAIETSQSQSGTAIVEDVKTGQILSMASLVSTHPDAAVSATAPAVKSTGGVIPIGPTDPVNEAPSNLAVTQVYEPGSVFKLVTFSAALSEGLINPGTVFTVPDEMKLDGSTFHDAEPHPTESLTSTQILAQSSNIGTGEIAQDVGEQRLLEQVRNLGFGSYTGLGFPGESPGLLATAAQWEPTDYVSLPIGQVDAVNALQVLDAYNAVANGGVFVQPKLIEAKVTANGTVTKTPASPTHRAFSPLVDSELTTMLEQVVAAGTGTSATVPGYTVAGKTGTAQIPTQGQDSYVTGAYMASFVGFAPAIDPTLSIIVVLDRPTPIYGGTVAAPVFSQIMSYALHRYDIPTTPGATTSPGSTTESPAAQAQDIT